MRRPLVLALVLAAVTLALYWPVRGFDLVYFDDPLVMTDQPLIAGGLTAAGLHWALTAVVIANWHPATNLSFLTVAQFFGHTPGAQHLANACIHAANAALLFLLLRRLTGAPWRSAVVAAIFAWHPQRVESVAWIIERKDVLCGFFFLLSLWFYASAAKAESPKSKIFLRASLLAFALALLSKPMAVTLPFVLLLLDVWPLQRFQISNFKFSNVPPLVREKIPFFALMLLFCAATFWIQHDYAAMTPWEKLGLAPRLQNAVAGYLAYPAQLLWPANLAAIYPYPKSFDATETALKTALLLAISALAVSQLKKFPPLAVGWCWYLGTALPIIGLIQVGEQAMADRYTYLPLIGPVVALVWTAVEIFSRSRAGKVFLTAATILILSTLMILSAQQLQHWRNTIELFSHNVAVTPDNASAHFSLGLGYAHTGDTNRALACYRVAKSLAPFDWQNRRSLATLLREQGQLAAATSEAAALVTDEPEDFQNHLIYAGLLAAQSRPTAAAAALAETLRLNPDCTEALNNLAWARATSADAALRDGPRAVALAQHACELTQFQKTVFIGTLGAALAEAGRFEAAIATAQRACDLAAKNGETDLLQRNQSLLELYRQHQPVRE